MKNERQNLEIMEKVIYKSLTIALLFFSLSVSAQNGETITGQVKYHGFSPMPGVTAYLNLQGQAIDSTITNFTGQFTFNNVLPGSYTLTFNKEGATTGVNLTDAFLVMLNILNLYPFNDIQTLAADVNGSGSVTWADYTLILVGYLNQGNPFPVGNWVFEEVPYTSGSRDGVTSKGSSSGDASGTFVPTKSVDASALIPTTEILSADHSSFNMEIASSGHETIGGMQLMLAIPVGLSVIDIQTELQGMLANLDDNRNVLTLTWLDPERGGHELGEHSLVSITVEAQRGSREQTYSLEILPESHFIDLDGNVITHISLLMPEVKTVIATAAPPVIYPNPCREFAQVEFLLANESEVIFTVFDQTGKLVAGTGDCRMNAGPQIIRADVSALAPGMYFYRLVIIENNTVTHTGSLIKSK